MSKVIVPLDYNSQLQDQYVTNVLGQLRQLAESYLQRATSNWDNKPTFTVKLKKGANWELEFYTEDVPFVWVDEGTEPHTIPAKGSGFLRFKYPYTPSTQPGVLRSGVASYGNNWATMKEVQHPGIEPRHIIDEVVKIIDKSFLWDELLKKLESL